MMGLIQNKNLSIGGVVMRANILCKKSKTKCQNENLRLGGVVMRAFGFLEKGQKQIAKMGISIEKSKKNPQ